MPNIHPTAIVDKRAKLAANVSVGPYTIIDGDVEIGEGVTRIGDDNWFMAYTHVAHDCRVGSNTIFANQGSLAGHAHLGDWAVVGGMSGVHQFVRVGAHA